MKKLMYVAALGMALGFASCGADDVIDAVTDLACESTEAALKSDVTDAIAAHANSTSTTCTALKTAIEAYRESPCGSADAYATELSALPDDCATLDNN